VEEDFSEVPGPKMVSVEEFEWGLASDWARAAKNSSNRPASGASKLCVCCHLHTSNCQRDISHEDDEVRKRRKQREKRRKNHRFDDQSCSFQSFTNEHYVPCFSEANRTLWRTEVSGCRPVRGEMHALAEASGVQRARERIRSSPLTFEDDVNNMMNELLGSHELNPYSLEPIPAWDNRLRKLTNRRTENTIVIPPAEYHNGRQYDLHGHRKRSLAKNSQPRYRTEIQQERVKK
tara:strand:+ start:9191 stop:9892 length:702 start_codon:yes stop_codon:yes gene_type:complete